MDLVWGGGGTIQPITVLKDYISYHLHISIRSFISSTEIIAFLWEFLSSIRRRSIYDRDRGMEWGERGRETEKGPRRRGKAESVFILY